MERSMANGTLDFIERYSMFSRKNDEFISENRHILYHMIDLRQTHTEQFNMLLILLIVSSRGLEMKCSIFVFLDGYSLRNSRGIIR